MQVAFEQTLQGTFPLQGENRLWDEATLVQKAKALDSEAWSVIYQRHFRSIHAYLYHRLGNPDLAEDMAATVFLQAVERIGSFDYRGIPLVAWLYRIAHNVAVDHLRRSSRIRWEPLDDNLVDKGNDPEKATEIAFAMGELKQAMGNLTEEQRQVIILRFVSDLSTRESPRSCINRRAQ